MKSLDLARDNGRVDNGLRQTDRTDGQKKGTITYVACTVKTVMDCSTFIFHLYVPLFYFFSLFPLSLI